MEIDINELPIPNWGLTCPSCGYALNGLPEHRCPECGLALDMPAIVRQWIALRPPKFTGDELPFPDFGLDCSRCNAPLAGTEFHECPKCGRAFDPQSLRPRGTWFEATADMLGGLEAPLVESVLQREQLPFFSFAGQSIVSTYIGGARATMTFWVPSEFFFELLWLLRRERTHIEETRTQIGAVWKCPACNEQNPGNFELCWNCGAEKQ